MLSGELYKNKNTYELVFRYQMKANNFPQIINNNKSSIGKEGKLEQLL